MAAQCASLRDQSCVKPVMVVADARLREHIAASCRQIGIDILDVADSVPPNPVEQIEATLREWLGRRRGLARILGRPAIQHGLPVDLWRIATLRRALPLSLAFWQEVIARERPLAVMLPGDRELGFVPFVLAAAHELNIPRVIATPSKMNVISLSGTRRDDRRFRVALRDHPPFMNILAGLRYPKQRAETEHGEMLFSPGWLTLALRPGELLSDRPWVQGGGASTHLFVEGEATRQKFISAGVDVKKIVIIGDLAYDDLHERFVSRDELRRNLTYRYGLNPSKKLLVLAVPIYAEHNVMPWPEHIGKLVGFCQAISREAYDVLMSFHPKSDPRDYEFLQRDFGFVPADEPLSAFLPAGDVFLCGNSTTIDWALKCGIPSVNLDYAKMNDRDYFDGTGAFFAQEPSELRALFETGQLDKRAKGGADPYFDGRAAQRFVAFAEGLQTVQRQP